MRLMSFPPVYVLIVLSLGRLVYSSTQDTLLGIVGNDFVMIAADSAMSQSIAMIASDLDKIAVLVDPQTPDRVPGQQQTVIAAAAGNSADADRLIGVLTARATIEEYENGLGCDVDYISCDPSRAPTIPKSPEGYNVEGLAETARELVAQRLRSPSPYRVSLLVAGMQASQGDDEFTEYASQNVQPQIGDDVPTSVLPSISSVASKGSTLHPHLYWIDEYGSIQRMRYGAHGLGSNFVNSILDREYRPGMSRSEAVELLRTCFGQLRQRYVVNSPTEPCIKCVDVGGCFLWPAS